MIEYYLSFSAALFRCYDHILAGKLCLSCYIAEIHDPFSAGLFLAKYNFWEKTTLDLPFFLSRSDVALCRRREDTLADWYGWDWYIILLLLYKWTTGCEQSVLQNYTLVYRHGYDRSMEECMFCHHIHGPFVAKTELFKKVRSCNKP